MWSSNGREPGVGRGYARSTARKRRRSTSTSSADSFYCFGCHEKGDAITFLTKIEQRPFMDVLQELAGAAGIDLDVRPLSPAERQARQKAESERDRNVPRDGAGRILF
jgi:DNA primase